MGKTKTSFKCGGDNPKWKGGKHETIKGYIRIRTKENRGKFQHRLIIERMLVDPICLRYVFPEVGKIPVGMTVEHLDHRRAHNCSGNLMLLDKAIHDAISGMHRWYLASRDYSNDVPF